MKAIIFDFDGVIHDTREDLFKLHKQFHPEENYEIWLQEAFGKNSRVYFEAKFDEKQKKEFNNLWTEVHKELEIHDEMKAFLLKLKKKLPLFIITSNTEENLNLYFESNNLSNLFDDILGAETHHTKTEKFQILFQKYNLKSDEVLFITDTLGDILEANKVNVKTIAVDFGYHERVDLEKGNPFRIVSNLNELLTIIESM